MKAMIITLAVTILTVFSNNIYASNKNKTYSSTTKDSVTGVITTITSEGKNDLHLQPVSKLVEIYDQNGILTDKTTYKWSKNQKQWIPFSKYQLIYGNNNMLKSFSYNEWDEKTNSWKENVNCSLYLTDGKPLSTTNNIQ